MLTRTAFGLAVALAFVSGALADPRAHTNDTQTISGAAVGAESGESGPVWGFKLNPPQENNTQAVRKSYGAYTGAQSEPRSERSESGPVWGFPLQQPANRR